MPKKLTSIALLISTLLLTACSSGSTTHDWTKVYPNMPAEFKTQEEAKITASEEALKKDPKDFTAQFQIGYSLQQLGEYGKAEQAYLKAQKLDPNNEVVLNNLADIYEQVEEYQLAAETIKKLYILNPDSIEVVSDTVRILLKADMELNAQEALENFARKHLGETDPSMAAFLSEQHELILNYKNKNDSK